MAEHIFPSPQPVVCNGVQLREALSALTFAVGADDVEMTQVHLSEPVEGILRIQLYDSASGDEMGTFEVDYGQAPGETGRFKLVEG